MNTIYLFFFKKFLSAFDDFKVFITLNFLSCLLLLVTLISLKISYKIKTDKINSITFLQMLFLLAF